MVPISGFLLRNEELAKANIIPPELTTHFKCQPTTNSTSTYTQSQPTLRALASIERYVKRQGPFFFENLIHAPYFIRGNSGPGAMVLEMQLQKIHLCECFSTDIAERQF